jgi:large conductance mechanosensitive channel
MLKEFREFIMRGNVLDLAIGVIIGGAFGKIVTSLVNDIIMPLLGLLTGSVDFSERVVQLGSAQVLWGAFVQNIIDFLIIALIIFLIVKAINRMKKPETQKEPTVKECPYCLSVIHIKATRCPECTSELEAGQAAARA